jgi:hypothetical protein
MVNVISVLKEIVDTVVAVTVEWGSILFDTSGITGRLMSFCLLTQENVAMQAIQRIPKTSNTPNAVEMMPTYEKLEEGS